MTSDWKDDQVQAALNHTQAISNEFQSTLGWEPAPTRVDYRIGVFAEDVRLRLLRGEILLCQHTTAPEPMFMAIAAPDKAYCERCASDAIQAIMADLSRALICDLCGAESSLFAEVNIRNGPFLMLGNVCPDCRVDSFS